MSSSRNTPRDVLFHLSGAVLLYVTVGATLTLLFRYVDILFPDVLDYAYNSGRLISFPLATLIVIAPVYAWVMRLLYVQRKRNPDTEQLGVRRWLIYITMFLAGALIIGDLVALIFTFLNGEVSARFLLKVAALLLVAGSVFGYYLYELRREAGEYAMGVRVSVAVIAAAFLAIVIGGFVIGGSPFEQRQRRLDEQRVSDLSVIQYQIVNYWNQKGSLPPSIEVLRDDIAGFVPPVDPETGELYEYGTTGVLSFDLCAAFALPYRETQRVGFPSTGFVGNPTWEHEAGRACFSRTIDPELHKAPAVR